MRKSLIFYTLLCEKIGIISKEDAKIILENNQVQIKNLHHNNEQ